MELDPTVINRMLTEALAKSAIGETLNQTIRKEVERIGASYNNPIEPVVRQFVQEEIVRLVKEQYTETIRERVKAALTDVLIEKIVAATLSAVQLRLDRDY